MAEVVTNIVEAAVGLGCLVAAVLLYRRPGNRWLTAVLAIAGWAALVHAFVAAQT